MNYFIGLDVGTSGVKVLLVDESGKIIETAVSEYQTSTPKALWSEQDPEDWWKAAGICFNKLFDNSGVKNDDVKAVGLTGQMHGLVLLDEAGNVIRPCIMWNDQRTGKECKEITDDIGFDQLLKLTGNQVLPGFTAPKIVWVKKNEPDNYNKIRHILLPKDYIRYKLTGEFVIDVSDASGTSLLNVKERKWSDQIIERLDIDKSWLPKVMESVEISGKVSKKASEITGLKEGTPVAAGAGDQAAGGIGTGTVKEGITSVVLGTSGVVFSHSDNFAVEPEGKLHSFAHAVPGAYHFMGVTLAAAGSFKWFRETLGEYEKVQAEKSGKDPYDLLTARASNAPAGSEGLFYLPYISGERTPHPDPNALGSFIGFTVRHNKEHFIRAVLEGVAYSLRDCYNLIEKLGPVTDQIRISGGGARSELWRQIIADVFNREVVTLTSTEGAPYGAALIAAAAVKHFDSVEEACRKAVKVDTITEPEKTSAETYEKFYNIYEGMYGRLKETFHSISGVADTEDN